MDPEGAVTSFAYDSRSNLTAITTQGITEGYGYDAVGNLTSVTNGGRGDMKLHI